MERSFDLYAAAAPKEKVPTPRLGYHARPEDPRDHTFLSKMGENNREAKEILKRLTTEEKRYFNHDSQLSNRENNTVSSSGAAVAVNPVFLANKSPVAQEQFEEEKENSIRHLREKYNQMLRESLERKASN